MFGLSFDEQLKQELMKNEELLSYERYREIMELVQKAFND